MTFGPHTPSRPGRLFELSVRPGFTTLGGKMGVLRWNGWELDLNLAALLATNSVVGLVILLWFDLSG